MKILLVISKYLPEYSGPAFRINNSYKRIKKKYNLKLNVFCQSDEANYYKKYKHDNIEVERFRKIKKNNRLIFKIINQLYFFYLFIFLFFKIKTDKYDLIHIAGNSSITLAALYISRIKKIPIFFELVNASSNPSQYNRLLNIFFKLNLKKDCVISCISNNLKKKCNKIGLKSNIYTRPNPVNQNIFNYKFKVNKYTKSQINLLYVSQFMPRKNQIFLIKVLKNLPKHYKLTLAGPYIKEGLNSQRDLNYFQEINSLINNYNIDKQIKIIPYFTNFEELIYDADIYLMPAYNEGLGTTLLESISSGVPVFANSNESAFRQWIKHDYNGKLIDMDINEWAKEILNFNFEYDSKKISQNILNLASSEKIDEQILGIYKALKNNNKNSEVDVKKILNSIMI